MTTLYHPIETQHQYLPHEHQANICESKLESLQSIYKIISLIDLNRSEPWHYRIFQSIHVSYQNIHVKILHFTFVYNSCDNNFNKVALSDAVNLRKAMNAFDLWNLSLNDTICI